jgi:hypothetical protein
MISTYKHRFGTSLENSIDKNLTGFLLIYDFYSKKKCIPDINGPSQY